MATATESPSLAELAHSRAAAAERVTRLDPGTISYYAAMTAFAAIFMFPFFWTVSSSLKQPYELFEFPPSLLPAVPQFKNYLYVLQTVPFLLWVWNSVIVVSLSTLGILVSSSLVAYSFARFQYRGRNALFVITLATMMLPAQVTLIPQYILFNDLHWINTLLPLWAPSVFGGAFFIFLLRQFILSLPAELDEAALIDGASYLRVYWSILMPLCKPALATVAIISFISSWNDFLDPLVYLNSQNRFTIALGLKYFQNFPEQAGLPMQHLLMAASVMAIAPCLILFFSFQRYFVEGVVLSGIKG